MKNNICVGHGADFDIPFAISSNNLSEDSTGDSQIPPPIAAQFILYGSPTGSNLLLATGSFAIDIGVDLGTIPQNIETDITGYSRPTAPPAWDAGANEFVSGGPSAITRNITDGLIFAETYTRVGGAANYNRNVTDGILLSTNSPSLAGGQLTVYITDGIQLADGSPTRTLTTPAKQIYFSVGTSTTDFNSGGPTVTIAGKTATFLIAVTANIGVGDVIEYGGNKAYISGKVSQLVWSVTNNRGDAPTSTGAGTTCTIKRVFNSLYDAVDESSGFTNDLLDEIGGPGFENLVADNISLNVACYDDGTDMISDIEMGLITWDLDADHRIRIFTPANTSTECNQRQRHVGIEGGGGYKTSGGQIGIEIGRAHV